MEAREIPEYLEELFSVFRLYGWCDRVHKSLAELADIKPQKTRQALIEESLRVIRKNDVDKPEAFLSLLILRRAGVSAKELYQDAYRALRNRLYLNDFPFIIRYLFDNKIPLPKSLVYDITERLFFSIEEIYSKIVEDFKRVPFKSAEDVVFYLLLQNCRVDLNSQNKELICIILLHIEVKIPAYIIDDIVDYMDENATLKENWKEQREKIKFLREEKKEEEHKYHVDKEKRDTSNLPAEHIIDIETPKEDLPEKESTKISDYSPKNTETKKYDFDSSYGRKDDEEDTTAERASIELDNRKASSSYDKLVKPIAETNTDREAQDKSERPKILPDKQDAKNAEYLEYTGLDKKDSKKRKTTKKDKDGPKAPVIGHRDYNIQEEAPDNGSSIKKATIEYGDFIDPDKERGIRLDRLDKNRWKKDKPQEEKTKDKAAKEKESQKTVKKNKSDIDIKNIILKNKNKIILALSFILLALLLFLLINVLVPKKNSSYKNTNTTEKQSDNEQRKQDIANEEKARENTADLEVDSGIAQNKADLSTATITQDFSITEDGSSVIWHVKKGQSFYSLYEYIKKNREKIPAAIKDLADYSWQDFISYLQTLNNNRFSVTSEMDIILPQEYLFLRK